MDFALSTTAYFLSLRIVFLSNLYDSEHFFPRKNHAANMVRRTLLDIPWSTALRGIRRLPRFCVVKRGISLKSHAFDFECLNFRIRALSGIRIRFTGSYSLFVFIRFCFVNGPRFEETFRFMVRSTLLDIRWSTALREILHFREFVV